MQEHAQSALVEVPEYHVETCVRLLAMSKTLALRGLVGSEHAVHPGDWPERGLRELTEVAEGSKGQPQ